MAKMRCKKRLIVGVLAGAALALAIVGAFSNLNRALISLAEARAEQRALQQISLALDDVMHKSLDYEDLVDVHYDENGGASMLSANTILMNRIAADAAIAAQENIDLLADEGIVLPLGSALGSGIFSGKGPRVRFEILPVGTVKTTFVTEFESAGINQTRHKISLEATASVRIVLPSGARTVSVQASALMAESILIGEVPQSYIQVPETGDALNFLA
ncbi:MAG TPA: sporulation protein YunB [Candidatus Pullichristensenella stercorigallinarum]|uniref:Sporulation protein YunB n=1 Tax=Candidatus Pullichristensenella stercorigallinarum TaxID=2840909 RepID=A0A9D0ZKJ8_9FIRM|nr:sporulation protein YunB [Candidatus Pullichristensenella stercorigallinarum]